MSVLIKGVEMPYGCADCDFCGGIILPDGIYCCDCPAEASHGKNISDAIDNDTRADFCPLVEVKEPHGRLIDIKSVEDGKFVNADNEYQKWWNGALESVINYAKTIIEAEGSEE